ncbi:uncharacterized protein [Hyperolius riggenbachi]
MATRKKRGGRGKATAKKSSVEVPEKAFSTEDLIVRVQMYPELYDKGHSRYKDLIHARAVWMEIAEHFYAEHWYSYSDLQREVIMLEVKTRWRSVKDAYIKDLKIEVEESRSGSGASRRNPYKFKKNLEFLRNCVELRPTEDNICVDLDSDEDNSNIDPADAPADASVLSQSPSDSQTQPVSVDAHSSATNAAPAASKSSSSVHLMKKTKKNDNEQLFTSLKTVMSAMEREKNAAYTLAMSLIPMIEAVPQQNMFRLRHALTDAIQSCVSVETQQDQSHTSTQASVRTPPPVHNQPVAIDYGNYRYTQHCMTTTAVQGDSTMRPTSPYNSHLSYTGQAHTQQEFRPPNECQNAPYMRPTPHNYSTQYMLPVGGGEVAQNWGQTISKEAVEMGGQGQSTLSHIASSLTESLYLTDI